MSTQFEHDVPTLGVGCGVGCGRRVINLGQVAAKLAWARFGAQDALEDSTVWAWLSS